MIRERKVRHQNELRCLVSRGTIFVEAKQTTVIDWPLTSEWSVCCVVESIVQRVVSCRDVVHNHAAVSYHAVISYHEEVSQQDICDVTVGC